MAVPGPAEAQTPLLEVRGVSKQFGGTQALADVSLQRATRRDRRAARRERRRQVHAHQDSGRRPCAGCRPACAMRGQDVGDEPARPADRVHPPGPRPDRVDDGRREYLSGARLSRAASASSIGARRAHARRVPWPRSAPTSTPMRASSRSAAPRSRWWRSRARWPRMPNSWCSTNRRPACRPTRWRGCSPPFTGCARAASGMIYVSHRLDEVFEIADRMVILRDGRVVGERGVGETSPEEVILLIVGREPSQVFRRPAQRAGAARLVLEALTIGDVGPIDCTAARGRGASAWSGCAAPDRKASGGRCSASRRSTAGRVLLDGTPIAPASPRQAMRRGHQPRLRRPRRRVRRSEPDVSARTCSSTRSPPARSLLSYLAPDAELGAARELGAADRAAARTIPRCRSSGCPAATSRRSWSAAGCI